MPLKSWACKKAKLLQAPKLSLHVAPPISNNLPLFCFDDSKIELPIECIWRVFRVKNFLKKPESFLAVREVSKSHNYS